MEVDDGETPSNGRITVTVAAAAPPPPPPPQFQSLALALPIQQPRSGSGTISVPGGREDCWSEGATSVLIDAWGERYLELSRGNLKQKHWQEVADIVNSSCRENYTKIPKTDVQCKNRIDTVKKKYKSERSKIAAGGGPSKWPFYDRLDRLIGSTTTVPVGIPVGIRSARIQNQKQKKIIDPSDSDSEPEPEPESPDSADMPPETPYKRARTAREVNLPARQRRRGGKSWGDSVRELTRAIVKFGEAYEQAESSKMEQMVEMEKQRMKFAKELEMQRMQFFMKTQLEISQLKNNNHHRRRNNNNNIISNNGNNTISNNNDDDNNLSDSGR